jgi:rhodanese-related sulfurtransferase
MTAGRFSFLALAFLFIGVSAIAVGFQLDYAGIPLVWLGINAMAVGLNYRFPQRLNLFGKTDGRVGTLRKMLLLPFFVLLYTAWHLLRKISRESPFAELVPGILIGRRLLPDEYPPVSTLVDLTAEMDEHIPNGANLLAFPLLDGAPAEPVALRNMARTIAASTKPIYIHCAQGHGRTSMVAAAVLIEMGAASSVPDALQMIRTARPHAKPNRHQHAALLKAFV